jgi:hypothetical protein
MWLTRRAFSVSPDESMLEKIRKTDTFGDEFSWVYLVVVRMVAPQPGKAFSCSI